MVTRAPRTRQSDLGGPIFFGIFTLAGVIFILVAKGLHAPPAVVTSVPVALMLAYAAAIVFFPRLRLRDDQTGDNFYYMGFILTLTSLAVSLFQYSGGSDVSEIVSNFGIAVASTIAGIVLRIFFNLLRRDPIEVEHVARLELADAAKRVRLELNDMQIEMAHFRRTNQQMLAEGFAEIRSEVQKSTEATMASVASAGQAIEAQTAAFLEGGAVGKVSGELAAAAETLRSLNATLTEIEQATRRSRGRSWFTSIFGRFRSS